MSWCGTPSEYAMLGLLWHLTYLPGGLGRAGSDVGLDWCARSVAGNMRVMAQCSLVVVGFACKAV